MEKSLAFFSSINLGKSRTTRMLHLTFSFNEIIYLTRRLKIIEPKVQTLTGLSMITIMATFKTNTMKCCVLSRQGPPRLQKRNEGDPVQLLQSLLKRLHSRYQIRS